MIFFNHNYDFRNQEYGVIDRLFPTPNAVGFEGCTVTEDWEIVLPTSSSRLVDYYSHDLPRFLSRGFGLCPRLRFTDQFQDFIKNPYHKILLLTEADMSTARIESKEPGAFHITVAEDYILIIGKSERGTAQGVYYIEDHMRLFGKPLLRIEDMEHAPLFSPRMTHSGFELDTFSDSFLEACAHAGMDSIIVFAGSPDTNFHGFPDPNALWPGTGRAYCDFNHLIWRAEGYGLDVYIYSGFLCDVHPDDLGAREYYEKSFGTLFKKCPKLKGIIFVGECFEFPSKDPHTSGIRHQLKPQSDPRPSPGWYPCEDYPQMVTMVKDIIRAYNPTADLVFWSYNWGWAPKEARLALIEKLPRDISLLVTFEMWENLTDDNNQTYWIADYSLSLPGPSQVFVDEAQKAKELGLRLYAMSNTGGRTWDVGSAPYLPAPQQWQKRYEALCEARNLYGLCGLMENHHYGWMPSFLDLFSKNAFTSNSVPNLEMLTAIAKRDFLEEYETVLLAWKEFSIGISEVVACNLDQYGPYRSGPTYPLTFLQTEKDLHMPFVEWAWHPRSGIWNPIYSDTVFENIDDSLMRLRHVSSVTEHFRIGVDLMETVAKELGFSYGSEQSRQIAVARYIYCSYLTAKHVMLWNIAKRLLFFKRENNISSCVDDLLSAISVERYTEEHLATYMRAIAEAEKKNVTVALDCWQEDSRLGFEASMEYVFDSEFASWKLNEIDISLKQLDEYLSSNSLNLLK
jgi:hypothetical protein